MNGSAFEERKGMKRSGYMAGAAIVALALAVIVFQRASYRSASDQGAITFVVKEGPLTISITESGTVSAREQVILKSEVEGQARIIWLMPEGTHASKGDLLVELDSSNLVDKRVDQQIRVQNREATYIGARENLAVVKNQAKSDVTAAELD